MTEEEAKEKWCPMVRYQDVRAISRDACFDHDGTHCIGSACMMWRSELVRAKDLSGLGRLMEEIHGYCGLAGKP